MSSYTIRQMPFAPLSPDGEVLDASAGHGGFRTRLRSSAAGTGTAGRGTLATASARIRPQAVGDLFPKAQVSTAANGASGANGANGANGAGTEYDVGVDTVLQEAAAAAGGSAYYPPPDAMTVPMPVTPLDQAVAEIDSMGLDPMVVSGDIEEPKEGIMGFVEKNPEASAALAALRGFLGYRYAKKQGMI